MGNQGQWRGRVTSGRFEGYDVEVRASGEPLPIYVIAYGHRRHEPATCMGFAVGHDALREHFVELEATVRWEEEALQAL